METVNYGLENDENVQWLQRDKKKKKKGQEICHVPPFSDYIKQM